MDRLDELTWHSSFPDLSSIEQIWSIVCRQLESEVPAANLEALRGQVLAALQYIPDKMISNTIDSMHWCIIECISAHGSHILY